MVKKAAPLPLSKGQTAKGPWQGWRGLHYWPLSPGILRLIFNSSLCNGGVYWVFSDQLNILIARLVMDRM